MEPSGHIVEPELQGTTPRKVVYTSKTQLARMFFVALLVGVTWLVGWLGTRDLSDLTALENHGATATGHITNKYWHAGRSSSYEIYYAFTAGGHEVDDHEFVSASDYYDAHIGNPFRVTYLPEHPQTERVGDVTWLRLAAQRAKWAGGTLLTAIVLGLVLLAIEMTYRGHRRLLETGVAVSGIVTDRQVVRGKNNTYYLLYEFPGPYGAQSGKTNVPYSVFEASTPGDGITVLYDSAKPKYSMPYSAFTDVRLV